jgi:hypothetical protein
MCVLLGTLAWGQAAPSAPTSAPSNPPMKMGNPMAPGAAAQNAGPDTSASVPENAAVITVIGVCPPQPKPAAAKGTAAKPVVKAKTAEADCKTVITKAQFEELAKALIPNVTPQTKKQLAGVLPRFIGMSGEAKKEGLEKTKQFDETVKFAKMQILTSELQRKIQEDAAKIPPEDIEKYYNEHAETFEQFNLDRLYVPRNKQPEAEANEEQKDEKLSDDEKRVKEAAEKTKSDQGEQDMTKLAESLQARAAAGEDFAKLQKEAYEAAGMKMESPSVNLPNVRRTGLPPAHAAVFDLKTAEVSQVISDSGGHYVYKLVSTTHIPLDQATNEIHSKLQNDRTREMMDKVTNSFKVETNDAYFPGGVGTAPPPRMPRPRPVPSGPTAPPQAAPSQTAPPQTQPPAQPPAAKPN